METERRRSIILWGPPGSGKSLYLTSLVMWLTRERDEQPYAVLPADDASATWVARRSAPHPDGVALVPSSPAPGSTPSFRIYSIAEPADAYGPRSSLVADLTPSEAAAGEPFAARLDEADGVMLLLPVATMAASADARDACVTWLTTTLARLPEQLGAPPPAVSIPVAVCLTQTDEAPDAVRRDATRWLESFGGEAMRALRAHCARFALFKISSLGRTPRRRDGTSVLVGAPEPRGVLAPIRWILAETSTEAAA
ncbi:MAG TPA: ATP-binding protein [Gemmatimonadaceae bacterium]